MFPPKRPFLPSTKDQSSESRAMRDRYPLVNNSDRVTLQGKGNNFQFEFPRMKLPSTAIFLEGVKGKQRPFGLQFCAPHGRTFVWHFRWIGLIDGENAPHSPFASVSVCDVRDLRHGSRAYFEIKTSKRNSAWSACISSFVNILTFMAFTFD